MRGLGPAERALALQQGIDRWDDARLTCAALKMRKTARSDVIDRILRSNRCENGAPLQKTAMLDRCVVGDCFVDFETSSEHPLTDFTFMIGVGRGNDDVEVFTATDATLEAERLLFAALVDYLHRHTIRRLLHWAPHEVRVVTRLRARHEARRALTSATLMRARNMSFAQSLADQNPTTP